MPRRLLLLLVSLLMPVLAIAQVYSWVDSKGMTHYTDAPPPGSNAQPVNLAVSPSVGPSPNAVQVADYDRLSNKPQPLKEATLAVSLITPEAESTLRDNTGDVVFQAAITPTPPSDFSLRFILDGKPVATVKNALAVRLQNLDRGTHRTHVELYGKDGTILAKSTPITFYLHRARISAPPKPKGG